MPIKFLKPFSAKLEMYEKFLKYFGKINKTWKF